MATSGPSTHLSALNEEEVVTWSEPQLVQSCVHYNLVLLAPLPDDVALCAFFLRIYAQHMLPCVGTVQDGGGSPSFPPPLAKTPPLGSEAQGKDPTMLFGCGPIGHSSPSSPPPLWNLATELKWAAQFARDNPNFHQDMMDSL